MASTCESNRLYIKTAPTAGYWWYWKKDTRNLDTAYAGAVESFTDYYELPDGAVIGVSERTDFAFKADFSPITPGSVLLYYRDYANTFTGTSVIELLSTSGDVYNKLLSVEVDGYDLIVRMFSVNFNEVTELIFALPQIYDNQSPAELRLPCLIDYTRAAGEVLKQYCDQYTLVRILTDGAGDIEYDYVSNSSLCGYVVQEPEVFFTEEKTVEVREGCYKNPVFMIWRNTLGGWDSWLFEGNQINSIETESRGFFASEYSNIANLNIFNKEIGKNANSRMTLGAEMLTIQQKEAITQVTYSNKVYILNSDGTVQNEVTVLPGTFVVNETRSNSSSIQFEVVLKEINTISN
jgi:hypothetical protein